MLKVDIFSIVMMLGIIISACAWKWSYSFEAMDAILGHASRNFSYLEFSYLNTLRHYFTVLVQLQLVN